MIIEATWTALLTATGSTKAVVTPYIANPITETGAIKEYGSGNEVRDGIPIVMGSEMTKFTARFYNLSQAYILLMKDWMCENLEVILINELGQFGHRLDGTSVKGFPVKSLFFGDKKLGGLDEPDVNEMQFSLRPHYSNYFTITDPTANFSALNLINT